MAPSADAGRILLQFDGASKGNPGAGGYGVALSYAESGMELAQLHGFTGYHSTCNTAEWTALIVGMAAALQLGCENLTFRGDSQLVIRQMSGRYRVNAPGLKEFHRVAKRLEAQFKSVKGEHVPRAQNTLADKLSNDGVRDRSKGVWDLARFEKQCEERGLLPRRRA
jgi:ribonuclease HI